MIKFVYGGIHMRKFKNNVMLFTICALILQISFCPVIATSDVSNTPKVISEMRGVWVASVYNLDYPTNQTTNKELLKQEAIKILDNVSDLGLTSVFLQVRPTADALYDSDIFPWSRFLTGKIERYYDVLRKISINLKKSKRAANSRPYKYYRGNIKIYTFLTV